MAFYNTIQVPQQELPFYQEKNEKQKDVILKIMEDRKTEWLTPFHIQAIYKARTGREILIGNVRRCLTNLTSDGLLFKSPKATGKGIYSVANHLWTLR